MERPSEMRYASLCSGIEAASLAWEPLGWTPAWFAEIEPFTCAVLAHRWPHVPNHGDMTRLIGRILTGGIEAPDILVGGTPCQAFSVAGLRGSLKDERGNLTLVMIRILDAIDFIRARAGKPPCILVWENVPGVLNTRDNAFGCLLGGLAGEELALEPAGKKWTNAGAVFGHRRRIAGNTIERQPENGGNGIGVSPTAYTLTASDRHAVQHGLTVRRLTPLECERLQGMPDNHTRIPWRGKPAEQCPDAPRYKAVGNSMAVPVMRRIGHWIQDYLKHKG